MVKDISIHSLADHNCQKSSDLHTGLVPRTPVGTVIGNGRNRANDHGANALNEQSGDSSFVQSDVLPAAFRELNVPEFIANAGSQAAFRFLEYFTARIRNPGTRRAYYRNAKRFCDWMAGHRLELRETKSIHISTYLEYLAEQNYSRPTIKQHLATIRELLDWLVVGQVIPFNPAAAVRGPKHIVERGTTPILSAEEATKLLSSIDTTDLVGCRDHALITTMIYTFGRVTAVINIDVADYLPQGKRWYIRLHEKNGKLIKVPAHHVLEASLDRYIELAGGSESFPTEVPENSVAVPRRPLFRTASGRSGRLTNRRMTQPDAWRMIRRCAKQAGIESPIGNHTFRATAITVFLLNGGKIEDAQRLAGHSSPRTTKLYDRRDEELSLDEIERIRIEGNSSRPS